MTFPFVADTNAQSYTFRDAKGNTAKFSFYVNWQAGTQVDGATAAGAVKTALIALSNAALQAGHGLDGPYGVAQYGAHASGGAYESVIDKAVMVFQDAAGGLHRYEVPAPKIDIFKADKITVDPAATGMAALITAMTTPTAGGAYVITRQSIPLVNYMGGFYKARKLRRKTNVLVLQPDLTASIPAE